MKRWLVLPIRTFSEDHTLCHLGRSETFDIHPYRLERFASGDLIPDPQI
jgi:hypothetical protein